MKDLKLKNIEIASFAEQLSLVLKAGISSYEGLNILMEDDEHSSLYHKIMDLMDVGYSFYEAIKETNMFPDYFNEMVQIGELSGRLDEVMANLSIHYHRQVEINESIKSAVTYPMVMIVMMLLVVIVLITKVIPIFSNVFSILGADASGFKSLTNLSAYSPLLIGLLFVLLIVFVFFVYIPKGREVFMRLAEKLPLTKKLSLQLATSYFASGMSIALSSGLDIEESMKMSKNLVNHQELARRIDHCIELMKEQVEFDQALIESKVFTGLYARLVKVGFKSGAIDQAMNSIADQYDESTHTTISNMIAIIEPTLVVVLSIIVGVILLSVMLPLIGIMSNMG